MTKAARELNDVPHKFNQHANSCPIIVATAAAVAIPQNVSLVEFRFVEIMASLPDLNSVSNPR